MKYLLCIGFVIIPILEATSVFNQRELFQHKDACIEENNLNVTKFYLPTAVRSGGTRDAKCLMKCILEKVDVLDASGALNVDTVKEKVAGAEGAEAVDWDKCAAIANADECEAAVERYACVVGQFPRKWRSHRERARGDA